MYQGSCLCGAVKFSVSADFISTDACHCDQCRKWTGHFLASADIPRDSLTISGSEYITWYQSSEKVRRGFCTQCGSSLFFDPLDKVKHAWTSIALGAFNKPTLTHLERHIFVAEKGDYYDINDGLPQNDH
ncbi:glutathione-dependent formaldehyde-activating enzyme [Vibrio aerogenes CECT 7868]|uniref:Glutathione-dependent formaldehyde-activating enzyme n=1 Tax=Vibrio aerogenes CECT 7868 TaxID=1216006 RepID=A0A1M5XA94_9VIBR|nr:GFA family protein [Vibrio aerogenes]SHH96696.1 glutathione-dependent formaldehyde-activating enzyme [Vibrio aerogenes CECT 7868]